LGKYISYWPVGTIGGGIHENPDVMTTLKCPFSGPKSKLVPWAEKSYTPNCISISV